jgi:hypothetical protein
VVPVELTDDIPDTFHVRQDGGAAVNGFVIGRHHHGVIGVVTGDQFIEPVSFQRRMNLSMRFLISVTIGSSAAFASSPPRPVACALDAAVSGTPPMAMTASAGTIRHRRHRSVLWFDPFMVASPSRGSRELEEASRAGLGRSSYKAVTPYICRELDGWNATPPTFVA